MPDQDPFSVDNGNNPLTEAERAALAAAAASRPAGDATSFLAKYAYALGIDPTAYAERHITDLIEVHLVVAGTRMDNPAAFPGYCIELTIGALACRILGELLDAGWTAPVPASSRILE